MPTICASIDAPRDRPISKIDIEVLDTSQKPSSNLRSSSSSDWTQWFGCQLPERSFVGSSTVIAVEAAPDGTRSIRHTSSVIAPGENNLSIAKLHDLTKILNLPCHGFLDVRVDRMGWSYSVWKIVQGRRNSCEFSVQQRNIAVTDAIGVMTLVCSAESLRTSLFRRPRWCKSFKTPSQMRRSLNQTNRHWSWTEKKIHNITGMGFVLRSIPQQHHFSKALHGKHKQFPYQLRFWWHNDTGDSNGCSFVNQFHLTFEQDLLASQMCCWMWIFIQHSSRFWCNCQKNSMKIEA
jgi:hypothetical protein